MKQVSSDKILVKRVLDQDREAFRELIRKYERLVLHIVGRMVKQQEDREDLCQEVFLKVYHQLPGFRFEAKLSSWIGRIAYTSSLNHLRKKKAEPLGNFQESEGEEGESLIGSLLVHKAGSGPQPEQQLMVKESYAHLQKEIDALPAIFRGLVTMFHLEEMSHKEICQATGMPLNTVKNYLFRARKQLKCNLLKKYSAKDIWK